MSLRVRIIACIFVLSLLLSIFLFASLVPDLDHVPEYTKFTSADILDGQVYLAENWDGRGHIYRIDPDGVIRKTYHVSSARELLVHDLCAGNGALFAVCSTPDMEDGQPYTLFRVLQLDGHVHAIARTDRFLLGENEAVKNLSVENEKIHITTLTQNGRRATVYEIPFEALKSYDNGGADEEAEDKRGEHPSKTPPADVIYYRDCAPGSFYSDACYLSDTLLVRTDKDAPDSVFSPDYRIQNLMHNVRFSMGKWLGMYQRYIVFWAMGILIWYVLLAALFYYTRNRNRVFYLMCLLELVLVVVVTSAFLFAMKEYKKAGTQEYSRFALLSLHGELDNIGDLSGIDFDSKEYYNGDDYRRIQGSLARFAGREGNDVVFSDVFLLRLTDGMVLTSLSGKNQEKASWSYGKVLDSMASVLAGNTSDAMIQIQAEGEDHLAVGVTQDELNSTYALGGIIVETDPNLGIWSDLWRLLAAYVVLILAGSALLFFILYMQGAELRRFEKAMHELAMGRVGLQLVPETPAQDMISLWNSLAELQRKMAEINYSKYRIFEAYYRFAPKNIEAVMGKNSIFDVKNGEMMPVNGTIMMFSTERTLYDKKRMHTLSRTVSYMEQYAENREGILVSQDSSLSLMQLLFLESENRVTGQAVQFIQRQLSDPDAAPASIFLYYASFVYGIVGISAQSLTFLSTRHSEDYERYAKWFRKLGVYVVVTAKVKEREELGENRYIGFIRLKEEDSYTDEALYEVLDACPMRERQMKIINKEKFESALQIFYQKDFYTARNRFSEVLKECPEDEITRWYLFESERYLNEERPNEDFGALKTER